MCSTKSCEPDQRSQIASRAKKTLWAEKLGKCQAKARNKIFADQAIALPKSLRLRIRAMFRYCFWQWIDEPKELHAGSLIIGHLFVDFSGRIVLAANFDDQLGNRF